MGERDISYTAHTETFLQKPRELTLDDLDSLGGSQDDTLQEKLINKTQHSDTFNRPRRYKCPNCNGEFDNWSKEGVGDDTTCPFCGLVKREYDPDE